jgi:hypothetical protein
LKLGQYKFLAREGCGKRKGKKLSSKSYRIYWLVYIHPAKGGRTESFLMVESVGKEEKWF